MSDNFEIKDYIELYRKGIPLKKIKPLTNETYRVLMLSNAPIHIVHKKYLNYTRHDKLVSQGMAKNMEEDPYFYMIPVQTVAKTIVGFVTRSLFNSKYVNIVRRTDDENAWNVPKMFGWLDFKNYDEDDVPTDCYYRGG